MNVNDGGPAFAPNGAPDPSDDTKATYGMTLRDWFAGQAIEEASRAAATVREGDIDRLFGPRKSNVLRREIVAAIAYEIADAMIAERSK